MKSGPLSRVVCEVYCRYYKPAKKEDLECIGFRIVEGLLSKGRLASLTLPPEMTGERREAEMPGDGATETLIYQMCPECPFYESDCDFAAFYRGLRPPEQRERPVPCGGFIFLGLLLERKLIDSRDVHQAS